MLPLKKAQVPRDPRLVFLNEPNLHYDQEVPMENQSSARSSCFFLKMFSSAGGSALPTMLKVLILFVLTFNLPETHAETHRHRHLLRKGRETHPRMESYMGLTRAPQTASYRVDDIPINSVTGNDHKPMFTSCSSYFPEVYEGQPVNTSVIQVRAVDLDPINAGGKVTYSIVETTDDFIVDTHTGWIRTNKIFDRDEPAREKIAYVSVRATDNGRPQLDDVCNLKVIIRDINDNRPMFDKFEYRESIPRDMGVGAVVMRISATDIDDGNNGSVHYRLQPLVHSPHDMDYFEVIPDTGEVHLRQKFPDSRDSERTYTIVGVASDMGVPPETSTTNLSIKVIEPNQKPPIFLGTNPDPIRIKELTHDPRTPVAVLEANSGIANSSLVFFELLNGQTQATNKDSIFTSEASGNKVAIRVEKQLDYELVNQYTLTVRVSNKHDLAATTVLRIEVEDENDERPFFTDVKQGSVLENEPFGTVVMRVQAIDKDGTSPNNLVSYSLGEDFLEDFSIDGQTGEIRTRRPFDRETQDIYQLEVIAKDGAPSAILKPNPDRLPNERKEQIKVEIADKNDNPPKFEEPRGGYRAEIAENADIGNVVIEVKATDPDTESVISYSIEDGDPEGNFHMRSTSQGGIIYIQRNLDYETVRSYNLRIKASDSLSEVFTFVSITVTNVNDNPPVFEDMEKTVTILEETIPQGCIFTVSAYDPDVGDRRLPQGIFYFVDKKAQEFFSVNPTTGCVRLRKPLDRDPPNGVPKHQAFIGAFDEYGNTTTKLFTLLELNVHLTDINDNYPILNSTNPVVWDENQGKGTVTRFTAIDYDEDQNGPPFRFRLSRVADDEIRNSFKVEGNTLKAIKENFDREAKKMYLIPIEITDSGNPPQSGTSILTVIIGDKNDNPMTDGESKIFVYKYKENNSISIGRVYVNDLDDWDLPDKSFAWDGTTDSDFTLNPENGIISMRPSASDGVHKLTFRVNDNYRNEEARAIVTVTVKKIEDEAVDNSGSIRFRGITKEEFIEVDATGKSRQEKLQSEIARVFDLPESNVDVFTVLNPDTVNDEKIVDVRFSAHGSPYYKAEKLEGRLAPEKERLEDKLKTEILMIRVDECLQENLHCEHNCFNELNKSPISSKVFTNTSSFVGVTAVVIPECKCKASLEQNACQPNPCLHDGICHAGPNIDGFRCECREGYRGSRCETTSISFQGTGFAWYPPLSVCSDSLLQLYFSTHSRNGLILYNGPTYKAKTNVSDFISLELKDGRPRFLMDYGSGVLQLELSAGPSLSDGKTHLISLKWNPMEISMRVNECSRKDLQCFVFGTKIGTHSSLNVNGPLQLGGVSIDPKAFQAHNNWNFVPTTKRFAGCISNLTLNGEYYDLGEPSFAMGNVTSCDAPFVGVQVAKVGVGMNFIIILIVCFLVLMLLVIALVFYRRRRRYEEVKGEPNDDIRETIVNYSEEGGEGDHGGYDLSVLYRAHPNHIGITDEKNNLQQQGLQPGVEGSEMGNFVQGNKNRIDADPEGLPFDDLRNYAYEGDGNSIGSLSSLASATDDEDLIFDYLPTFGPRFKKLAGIYGGDSSSDDEELRRNRWT